MKFTRSSLILGAIVPAISAFPLELLEKLQNDPDMVARATDMMSEKRQTSATSAQSVFEAAPSFNQQQQYIDVSPGSGHEWQAPGPNDLRGPCPGLNAFANHGFLPRNGYATVQQYVDACTQLVGMGPDLALFLSVLGALIDSGDLMSWSMGGTPPPGVGPSTAQNGHGLIGSHNKYENDASPTRPDLYQSGNNYITQVSQFQGLVNASPGGLITMDSLTAYRSQRFDQQVASNPYFFNAPFPGLLVQPAAYTFIYRFMANHSAAEPLGSLSYETLQTWFGVSGTNGQYSVPNFGYERIPNNWYRRSLAAPYTIPYFLGDVTAAASLYPKFLSVGGNQGGQTNSFAGVDVANLTGGVFNSQTLLQGNNLGCFAFQASTQFKTELAPVDIIGQVQNVVGSIVKQLSCPQLQTTNDNALQQFPGYTRSLQN